MNLLTIQEVAELMKVSPRTVRRIVGRGDLSAYRIGQRGQLRVQETELRAYLDRQRVRPDAQSIREDGESR